MSLESLRKSRPTNFSFRSLYNHFIDIMAEKRKITDMDVHYNINHLNGIKIRNDGKFFFLFQ
jgi:hypothetical protein